MQKKINNNKQSTMPTMNLNYNSHSKIKIKIKETSNQIFSNVLHTLCTLNHAPSLWSAVLAHIENKIKHFCLCHIAPRLVWCVCFCAFYASVKKGLFASECPVKFTFHTSHKEKPQLPVDFFLIWSVDGKKAGICLCEFL